MRSSRNSKLHRFTIYSLFRTDYYNFPTVILTFLLNHNCILHLICSYFSSIYCVGIFWLSISQITLTRLFFLNIFTHTLFLPFSFLFTFAYILCFSPETQPTWHWVSPTSQKHIYFGPSYFLHPFGVDFGPPNYSMFSISFEPKHPEHSLTHTIHFH